MIVLQKPLYIKNHCITNTKHYFQMQVIQTFWTVTLKVRILFFVFQINFVHQHEAWEESRVVKFTFTWEALAFWEGCGTTYLVSGLVKKANILDQNRKYHTWTENQYLCDTINITQQVSDNHLHIEILSLQEMHKGDQIKTFWVKSCSQLNVLNKKDVSPYRLLKTIQKIILTTNH